MIDYCYNRKWTLFFWKECGWRKQRPEMRMICFNWIEKSEMCWFINTQSTFIKKEKYDLFTELHNELQISEKKHRRTSKRFFVRKVSINQRSLKSIKHCARINIRIIACIYENFVFNNTQTFSLLIFLHAWRNVKNDQIEASAQY